MKTILIIEDDKAINLGLQKALKSDGYGVLSALDGEAGASLALNKKIDLILLDVMLPKMNGYEIVRVLRKEKIATPVLMLTAKGEESDKVLGLNLGADDYVTKPFSVNELLARINAILRRADQPESGKRMRFGACDLNVDGRRLLKAGKNIPISPKEFDLLKFFLENRGRVIDRAEILNKVWGYDVYVTNRTIDNFVAKLRQKIEKNPDVPALLTTIHGTGYRFEREEENHNE